MFFATCSVAGRWGASIDSKCSSTADVSGEPVMRNARANARRRIAACKHCWSGCNHAPRPGRLPAASTVIDATQGDKVAKQPGGTGPAGDATVTPPAGGQPTNAGPGTGKFHMPAQGVPTTGQSNPRGAAIARSRSRKRRSNCDGEQRPPKTGADTNSQPGTSGPARRSSIVAGAEVSCRDNRRVGATREARRKLQSVAEAT